MSAKFPSGFRPTLTLHRGAAPFISLYPSTLRLIRAKLSMYVLRRRSTHLRDVCTLPTEMAASPFYLTVLLVAANFAEARTLSEEEAVRIALARNPDIIAARQRLTIAGARVGSAALLANPEVKIGSADAADDDSVDVRRHNSIGLRWSPPRLHELSLKTSIARSQESQAGDLVAVAEQKLVSEVRLFHRTLCLLTEQIRVADDGVRLREQIVRAVDEQAKAGVKTNLDRSVAELSLADARYIPARFRAQRRVEQGRLAAKLAIADPNIEPVPGGEVLSFAFPKASRESLLAKAIENRPEMHAAADRCTQTELTLKSVRQEQYPWLSSVQVTRRFTGVSTTGAWAYQAGVSLPVFYWNSRFTKAAVGEVEGCALDKDAIKASIVAEVNELLVRLEATFKELGDHRRVIDELIQRRETIAQAQLEAGQSDLVEPLLAQALRLSGEQAFLATLLEYRALEASLEQAVGDAVR